MQSSGSQAGFETPSTTAYASTASTGDTSMTSTGEGESGQSTYNGDLGSPKAVESANDATLHAVNLASYIFNVGYMQQQWADVQVTFLGDVLHLHRIILARSPYLAGFLGNPGLTIHLAFSDETITKEGVHIALQHLYNPALQLVTPANARSVLATAYLFGGMPELVQHAYGVCKDSLSVDSIRDYVSWIGDSIGAGSSSSAMYGSVMVPNGHGGDGVWEKDGFAKYGEWTNALKRDVLDYLINALPSTPPFPDPALASTYSHLPFDLFKLCTESPDLPISSIQDRFAFAKKVIAQRKKAAAASGLEELAVLAFRGGDGMELQITRKPKRRTAYTKVES